MEKEPIIRLEGISVSFDGEQVLKDFNLSIRDGEFVTLLGPSGCGKTTTLRAIAGFVKPEKGHIFFDGKDINNVPPHKRNVNTIFQRYAGFKGMETSGRGDLSQFGDTGALSNWAQEGVSWAVGAGLISGKGDGVLDPQGATTRAEAAVILQRFLEK